MVIEIDTACPGCSYTLQGENIWHIFTKVYSAWTVKMMFNMSTKLYFSKRSPRTTTSKDLWSLIGIKTSKKVGCHVVKLPKNLPPPTNPALWYSRMNLPDRLWSLSAESHNCRNSSAKFVWDSFRNSLQINLFQSRINYKNITEFNLSAISELNPGVKIIKFNHSDGILKHIQIMKSCTKTVGIHGAQMMNVMWMQKGKVIEYDYEGSNKFYYRNIAEISGLDYEKRTICKKYSSSCNVFKTTKGVVFKIMS